MKFRTEITPKPLARPIRLGEKLLSVGSCFSEHIAERLERLKFPIVTNPTGILFNPHSIASALEDWAQGRRLEPGELQQSGGLWFHYAMHGSLSGVAREATCRRMNQALALGEQALAEADCLLVTFGTAYIYELADGGGVVANCHKQPRDRFVGRMLSVEEIVERWSSLLEGVLRDKRVVVTLSPVRHLGDGAERNSLSKAVLRVAIAQLAERFEQLHYFPAWELVMDDLRDYRFYADDLQHPSQEAVRYVWERFSEAALDTEVRALQPRLESLYNALNHRPLHPETEAAEAFYRRTLQELVAIEALGPFDFTEEKARFKTLLAHKFE